MRVLGRNRWWIVLASVLGLTCGAGAINILTFGVFLKPITEEFGLGRGVFGLAMLLTTMVSVIAGPILGVLLDRYGARPVLVLGSIIFAAATAAQSLMTSSLVVIYALFLLKGACSAGISPISYGFAISQWFDRNRGLALGVAMSGVGLGTAFIPPMTAWLIGHFGWREAYLGLGGVMLLLAALPAALFMRAPSEKEAASHDDIPSGEKLGVTLREGLTSWRFWALTVAFVLGVIAINGTLTQVVVILTDRGVSLQSASGVLAASGIAAIAGRLASGWLVDRVYGPFVAVGFFALCMIGTVLIGSGWEQPAPLLGSLFVGAALGGEIDLMAFFVSRYFGLKTYGKIFGFTFGAFAGSTGTGPFLSGYSFDRFHTYTPAFAAYEVGLAIGCVLFLCLGPYPFPARHAVRASIKEKQA
jgi:MFS family permease